jgi:hypothetical protein
MFLIGALIGCSFFAEAQERSVGVRWAYGSGLAFRQKFTEKHAIEGILVARWGGVAVSGLYERERSIGNNEAWSWHYGGGFHLGLHRRSNDLPLENERFSKAQINVGIDLIAALAYRFREIPLAVSLDFKPTLSFTTEEWVPENFGLTGRWRF